MVVPFRKYTRQACRLFILVLSFSFIAGCNFSFSQEDSTPDSPSTAAALTLEVVSTHVALGTEIPPDHATAPSSHTETGEPSSGVLEDDCINKAVFVDDITIRDNTQIERGESFIKIWRLRNDGTCIWDTKYSLAFIGGDRMSAPVKSALSQVIQPGQTVDLSVDMTAPDTTGMHQGFWRLQSARGDFFGIGSNGDQSFWVKINVISSLTTTPTITSTPPSTASPIPVPQDTPSPTPSPTSTEIIHYQDSIRLTTDESIDLDNGEISPPSSADLSLVENSTTELSLVPQNNALFARYSGETSPPSRMECQNASLVADPISFSGLAVDDILCYSTDVGRFGYLIITALDTGIDFTFTTWGP
jgi:hypothetical protein